LSTIKLSKKPTHTPATGKTPVRRASNEMRDRTKAPVKRVAPEQTELAPAPEKHYSAPRPRRSETPRSEPRTVKSGVAKSAPVKSESARQRNHRYDGRLREDDAEQVRRERRDADAKPRGEMRDSRSSPRPSREEPHYRQAPRRGGKARDGYDANSKPNYANKPTSNQQSPNDLPRLSKLMAERGLCSRREADEWISHGWVKVNGQVVNELGVRVNRDVDIEIEREAKTHQAELVTILLHKPVGFVSGQAEDGYEPAVVLINPAQQWPDDPLINKRFKRGFLAGLAPAGRLDIDSTGLLVFTQDGRIARQLIGEDSKIEKEYLVRVEGQLSEEGLRKLNHGLSLDGVALKPAKVSWQNEDQLRFVLREGRKRQIRRMCELVGLHVVGLKRVRIGSVVLGKLPLGDWRYLRPDEKF
jgi:23S rRNA pseudouridine2604 synthase